MAQTYHITDDEELKARVRADTGYEDNPDELPEAVLDSLLNTAKLRVEMKTGSSEWYTDAGLGLVLLAYTCIRAKVRVENIHIEEYQIGNQRLRTKYANPDQDLQLHEWAQDIRDGLISSETYSPQRPTMQSTGDFIGGTYMHDRGTRY